MYILRKANFEKKADTEERCAALVAAGYSVISEIPEQNEPEGEDAQKETKKSSEKKTAKNAAKTDDKEQTPAEEGEKPAENSK